MSFAAWAFGYQPWYVPLATTIGSLGFAMLFHLLKEMNKASG